MEKNKIYCFHIYHGKLKENVYYDYDTNNVITL